MVRANFRTDGWVEGILSQAASFHGLQREWDEDPLDINAISS